MKFRIVTDGEDYMVQYRDWNHFGWRDMMQDLRPYGEWSMGCRRCSFVSYKEAETELKKTYGQYVKLHRPYVLAVK